MLFDGDLQQTLLLAAGMLATGAIGGILAGLLGVGGGIVIVPVLVVVLNILKVDPSILMHVAVATSLATIIPTSISSSRSHNKKGAINWDLVKRWAPAIVLGSFYRRCHFHGAAVRRPQSGLCCGGLPGGGLHDPAQGRYLPC